MANPKSLCKFPASTPSERSSTYAGDTDVEAAAADDASRPTAVAREKDPNVVDWDGEEDPERARNWPLRKKWTCIILLSVLTLLTCVVFPSLVLLFICVCADCRAALLARRCLRPAFRW